MALATEKVIPIFRIFDVDKAKEFYVGYLGFRIDWEHRFEEDTPVYMQVSLGELALHLSEHHGDGSPANAVFAKVTGLEAYLEELRAKTNRYLRPDLQMEPWNAKSIQVVDPFGNRIRFNEFLDGT